MCCLLYHKDASCSHSGNTGSARMLMRWVEHGLGPFGIVETAELRSAEGDCAEDVPREAPGRRRCECALHGSITHSQEDEKQRRVVIRKAIAELKPPGILIKKIHRHRQERGDSDRGVK